MRNDWPVVVEVQPFAKSTRPKNVVQSLERAGLILEVLSQHSQGLSLRDLSQKVNLTKGTAHRLLASLAYLDFIRQDPLNKHYLLSFKLVELGNRLLSQIDYRIEARPFLVELAESTRETAHMVILDQFEVLYIDKVEAVGNTTGLRMASMLGSRIPAHCCAVGKVLLAYLPEDRLEEFVPASGLTKRTENTITDLAKLKEHLQLVRRRGYAVDNEENEIGIRCVGAPVRNQRGEVIAAISLSVPSSRMRTRKTETMLKDRVTETAWKISDKLGYQGQ
jgi:DNA-binding IclR family transcriptional regulator